MTNSQFSVKKRLLTIIMLVTFIFVVLIFRLLFLTVIDSKELQAKALDQWTRDVPTTATRGNIYDSNGLVLATTKTQYTVYLRPNSVVDKEKTAKVLADVLSVDYEKLYSKLTKKGVSEITVAKKVTKEQVNSIKQEEVTGVYFSQDISRVYPYGDFMTQILGFTNIDSVGQSGLESYYDKYLKGQNGYQLTETDLVGRELNGVINYVPPISGLNVTLSVDYYIQALAEKSVKDAMVTYNAKTATCVVMNPKTGAVYALAQSPSFDLNNIPRDNVAELFSSMKSTAISNVYEPGSTFKILTSAIGLETGKFTDSYCFYCGGFRMVDGQRIKCWKTIGHGSQKFGEGINNSCNCLFMDIATTVGVNTMYDYFTKFGLNRKTGIDMVGESSGLLINQANVKNVDIARMGFGQAIAVTPIELLTAVSCVINGGTMITPYLLENVKDNDGRIVYTHEDTTGARVISENTSSSMRKYLQSVVDIGSGKNAKVEGYSIGGKTGTAQKYENGSIAQGKYVSSFIGFTSADNPEYLCLMIVDEPQGYIYYGSMVAAPYVGDIFKNIYEYKKISPTTLIVDPKYSLMPYVVGLSAYDAAKLLEKSGITYEIQGEGNITYQMPAPNEQVSSNSVAIIVAE